MAAVVRGDRHDELHRCARNVGPLRLRGGAEDEVLLLRERRRDGVVPIQVKLAKLAKLTFCFLKIYSFLADSFSTV